MTRDIFLLVGWLDVVTEGGVQCLFLALWGVSCKGRPRRIFIGVVLVSLRGWEQLPRKPEVESWKPKHMAARPLRACFSNHWHLGSVQLFSAQELVGLQVRSFLRTVQFKIRPRDVPGPHNSLLAQQGSLGAVRFGILIPAQLLIAALSEATYALLM